MSSYNCDKCTYKTTDKAHIKKHNKSAKCSGSSYNVIEGKAVCDICNKEFETAQYLVQHRKLCIEKKTKIIEKFMDSKSIMDTINELKNIISCQNEIISKISKNSSELIKRIEKLETKNTERKKGYDELDDDDDDRPTCNYRKIVSRKFADLENLLSILDKVNYDNGKVVSVFKVRVINLKTKETELCTAKPSGIYNYLNELYKYENTEVVKIYNSCQVDSNYKIIKTEECYCTKHFDRENCKSVD